MDNTSTTGSVEDEAADTRKPLEHAAKVPADTRFELAPDAQSGAAGGPGLAAPRPPSLCLAGASRTPEAFPRELVAAPAASGSLAAFVAASSTKCLRQAASSGRVAQRAD